MAIIQSLPSVTVTVKVAGQVATEYDDPDGPTEDQNGLNALGRTFKYIESKDDAKFSIEVTVDKSFPFLGEPTQTRGALFDIFIDGQLVQSFICMEKSVLRRPSTWATSVSGAKTRSTTPGMMSVKEFKFSAVTTVDDSRNGRVEEDIKAAKGLGVILVRFHRCIITGYIPPTVPLRDITDKSFELAEKSLKGKAISHGTSFSNGADVPARDYCVPQRMEQGYLAVFNFKYRSRDGLYSELGIPRPELPQPAGTGLDGPSKPKQEPDRKLSVKREVKEVYDLTGVQPQRSYKMVKMESGKEAVDLTDD